MSQTETAVHAGNTPAKAKAIIKKRLEQLGITGCKLTAKKTSNPFNGKDRIVVTVHGWTPDPKWETLEVTAKQCGFFLRADGDIS